MRKRIRKRIVTPPRTPRSAFSLFGHKVASFELSSPNKIRKGVKRREERQNTPPIKNNFKTHPTLF